MFADIIYSIGDTTEPRGYEYISHKSISVTNSKAPKLSLTEPIVYNEDSRIGSK